MMKIFYGEYLDENKQMSFSWYGENSEDVIKQIKKKYAVKELLFIREGKDELATLLLKFARENNL